jgi:MFS family permease
VSTLEQDVTGPMPAQAPDATSPKPKGRAGAVGALGFSQAVDNSEGGLINSFFPLIRNAFGLDYGALGLLSSLSKFARMIFGPLWAMAADRFGRKKVLFLVTGVWGLFTVASGFATSYSALLTLYIISVIGTVASEPIINGLLPDLFRSSERGKAYGMVRGIGSGLGIVIGPLIGQFGNNPDGWRWAMWVMGGISVLSGVLILLLVPKPAQKTVSVTDDPESGVFKLSDAGRLFKIPTVTLLALMLPMVTSLILLAFYATFVVDARGFTVVEGTYVMAVFSVGAMLSAFLGGFLGDLFARRFGPKGRIILMQIYLVAFAAVVFVTTQIDFGSKGAQYGLTFLMGLVFSIGFSGCVLPMVSTVVPRQLSATAFAMLFSLIQGGLTAVLSLLMGQLANVLGLSQTFLYVVVVPYLINAAFWFLFYRVYPRDVALQEQRSRQVEAAAAH